MGIKLLDILGIDRSLSEPDRIRQVVDRWPADFLHFVPGIHAINVDVEALVIYLQECLSFKSVMPGASPVSVGLYAECEIVNAASPLPLVIRHMPDIEFYLQPTGPGKPARVFVTQSEITAAGGPKTVYDIIIEALPVEIRLPVGLIEPESGLAGPGAPLTDAFIPGVYDSYKVELNNSGKSSIYVHTRIRITQEWDFIIEPAVVLSVGPCIFSGIPCRGLHDISFLPVTQLGEQHEKMELGTAWTRHGIEPNQDLFPGETEYRGVITVRSLDIDNTKTPFKELFSFINQGQEVPDYAQFVLEDIVIPFIGVALLPVPIHGTFALRRNILFGDRLSETFSFVGAPLKIGVAGFVLLVEELFFESFDPEKPEESQIARVRIAITTGDVPLLTKLAAPLGKEGNAATVQSPFESMKAPFEIIVDRMDPNRRELMKVDALNGTNLSALVRTDNNRRVHDAGATVEIDRLSNRAVTVGFTDDWAVELGCKKDEGRKLFTLGNMIVKLMGTRVGFSFKRLQEDIEWYKCFLLLFDFNIEITRSTSSVFRIELQSQVYQPDTALSEEDEEEGVEGDEPAETENISILGIGLKYTGLTIGESLKLPEGVQVVLFNSFKIIIYEAAMQTDKNGATYFSITGGLGFANDKFKAEIIVYRFRWRIAGNEKAALWLLDGFSFLLEAGSFRLSGTGIVSEFDENDHHYEELQFGLGLKFKAFGAEYGFDVFLYKGEVSGPVDNFKYGMFSLKVEYIPVSGIDLYNVRLLVAWNMAPNLAPADGSDQHLRLFNWYKTSASPLELSANRKLNAWKPAADTVATGIGVMGGIGGTKAMVMGMFVFGYTGPVEQSLLVAMEIFLLKAKKPVGFGVIEIDLANGTWALFIGVSISFNDFLPEGVPIPAVGNALSGTLYIGNKPGMFALGQLTDQNTWLGFRIQTTRIFKMEVIIAICIQWVNRPEGPQGFGFVFSAKGKTDFCVGTAEFYLTFLIIAGTWKNESSSCGIIIFFEAGFRIRVFRVFTFGASLKVQIDYLGDKPIYRRLAFELHIETPWYLPDVSIHFERIKNEPAPAEQPLVSTPIISAEAFVAGVRQETPLLLTALNGNTIDEKELFELETVRTLPAAALSAAAFNGLGAISVDSTIILNFKPPVDDRLTIGENTPAGAGTQQAVAPAESELKLTYELTSLAIRRQPLYGENAGVWTSFLAPEDSMLDPGELPDDATAELQFSSAIRVHWDRDVQAAGRWDPRRLLINSDTPFTVVTSDPESDESIVTGQPGWPCCSGIDPVKGQHWHRLSFSTAMNGHRSPATLLFTESSSTLHWQLSPRPLVIASVIPPHHLPAAAIQPMTTDSVFAFVSFDNPAFHFRAEIFWTAQHNHSFITIEASRGIEIVYSKSLALSTAQTGWLEIKDNTGFTSVSFRYTGSPAELFPMINNPRIYNAVEIVRMEYRTVEEERNLQSEAWKCKKRSESYLSGKGKLSWLANHNYEIAATLTITLNHNPAAAQTASITQKIGFRTKGMIGLNYVKKIGDEIIPYLEATYPAIAADTIYREEPVFMVFNEKFNILLPVDREISTTNPAELNQLLEWDLTVDKEGDAFGSNRASVSNADWIVANRGTGSTARPDWPMVITGIFFPMEREAVSIDPRVARLGTLIGVGCKPTDPLPVPKSQVLQHLPAGPDGNWQAGASFNVNLKPKNGPFIHRDPFEADDLSSFSLYDADSLTANSWKIEDGNMKLTSTTGDQYAIFGADDWNHLHIVVKLDPGSGRAGLLVAATISAERIQQALLAEVNGATRTMRIRKLTAGNFVDLVSAPLPESTRFPVQLDIIAYDDIIEVKAEELTLTAERESFRAGKPGLYINGDGSVSRVSVEALDAYRFSFKTSQFRSFEEHINSAGRVIHVLPPNADASDPSILINQLFTETGTAIESAMTKINPGERLKLFSQWAETLAIPFAEKPADLLLSRIESVSGTALLIADSPDPLAFARGLSLNVKRQVTGETITIPVNPNLFSLERSIAADLKGLENKIPSAISGLQNIQILSDRMTGEIRSQLVSTIGTIPEYALAALNHHGTLTYFLFGLRFMPVDAAFTKFDAVLIDGFSGGFFLNPALRFVVSDKIRHIKANEIILFDHPATVISTIQLPDLTLPYFKTQDFRILSNAEDNKVILIPIDSPTGNPINIPAGKYMFEFSLEKKRFRSASTDPAATYKKDVIIEVDI